MTRFISMAPAHAPSRAVRCDSALAKRKQVRSWKVKQKEKHNEKLLSLLMRKSVEFITSCAICLREVVCTGRGAGSKSMKFWLDFADSHI